MFVCFLLIWEAISKNGGKQGVWDQTDWDFSLGFVFYQLCDLGKFYNFCNFVSTSNK